jgi:hypothetical protein
LKFFRVIYGISSDQLACLVGSLITHVIVKLQDPYRPISVVPGRRATGNCALWQCGAEAVGYNGTG